MRSDQFVLDDTSETGIGLALSDHGPVIGLEAAHCFNVDIASTDIDFMGHVNNACYLNWVQSAVLSHWRRWATPEAIAAFVWVAIKHEITYRRPAFLNDAVVAKVSLECIKRESAFYKTVIQRGEEVLAQVSSRWCCLDANSLRPTRISDDVAKLFPRHTA